MPPRVTDPDTRVVQVLLRSQDFDWIRGLLEDEPDVPRLRHRQTDICYALVPAERYERFKAFFEEDHTGRASGLALRIRQTGRLG